VRKEPKAGDLTCWSGVHDKRRVGMDGPKGRRCADDRRELEDRVVCERLDVCWRKVGEEKRRDQGKIW
jgi:hypothetical protein